MLIIETVGSEEYCFESPNTKDVKELIEFFLDGLKSRSKYLVAVQDSIPTTGNISFYSYQLIPDMPFGQTYDSHILIIQLLTIYPFLLMQISKKDA